MPWRSVETHKHAQQQRSASPTLEVMHQPVTMTMILLLQQLLLLLSLR